MTREKIGLIARMEWDKVLRLMPAMGRAAEDCRLVMDHESPGQLTASFLKQVVNMVVTHGVVELFVVGSSERETEEDILERVVNLRVCGQLPEGIPVHGLLCDPATFRLQLVCSGYKDQKEKEAF